MRWSWALAAGLFAAAAHAGSSHYVVFELDASGRAQPQFHARVERATGDDEAIDARALAPGKRRVDGGHDVHVRAYQGSTLRAARVVDSHALRRSEVFSADGGLQARVAPARTPAFAVRVPAHADTLQLDFGDGAQHFDLAALAADAKSLPLAAGVSTGGQITHPKRAGPAANRVDLLIVGDGYTAAEEAVFERDAEAAQVGLFSITPYAEYASLVNVSRLFVASPQAGADHPPYSASCSDASCCRDAGAIGDPRSGWLRETAFDATFCSFQIQRLLTVRDAKVLAAAAAAPDWDRILVLVNDPVYGGSGGALPVVSTERNAVLIVAHEYGHSFTGLADEYDDAAPGYPTCSDLQSPPTCEANVTDDVDPARSKWRAWFTPGHPLPTPTSYTGVGLFEGARYQSQGLYRPVSQRCLMRSLAYEEFCPVCAEQYVLALYRGGSGVPAAGIDLIEPGSESPSSAQPLAVRAGTPLRFAATVLAPAVAGIEREWLLDGVPIAGARGDGIELTFAADAPQKRSLELRVTDRGKYLHPQHASEEAVHRRVWRLTVRPAIIAKARTGH